MGAAAVKKKGTEKAQRLIQRFHQLKQLRQDQETDRWRHTVELVVPMYGDKWDEETWADRRNDTSATESSHQLADAMSGNICPSTLDWFLLRFEQDELNDNKAAVEWLQDAQKRLYRALSRSNFYDVTPRVLQLGNSIATASVFIDEDAAEGKCAFTVLHPAECYIAANRFGEVNTIHRAFKLTAEQIEQWIGRERMTLVMQESLDKRPDDEYDLLHVIEPRVGRDPKKEDAANMPYASYLLEQGGEEILHESGYKTFPAPTWRWDVQANNPYGYGPTDDGMPDIKTLNAMMLDLLDASHKAVDPAKFVPKELRNASFDPGAVNIYRDPNRQPYTFQSGAQFPVTLELIQYLQERIRAHYKVKHFLMLTEMDSQPKTAREIIERKQEKVSVVGSVVGRFDNEYLDRVLMRVFQIEYDAGRLPPLPPELGGAGLKIEYVGPLAQAQKQMQTVQGVLSALEYSAPLISIWPELKMKFRPEVMLEEILESHGMPEKAIVSDKDYQKQLAAAQQKQAQAEQAAMMAEMGKAAGGLGKAIEPGSMAEQMAGGGGGTGMA